MNVLITGGAGYIGSHAVKKFLKEGPPPLLNLYYLTKTFPVNSSKYLPPRFFYAS